MHSKPLLQWVLHLWGALWADPGKNVVMILLLLCLNFYMKLYTYHLIAEIKLHKKGSYSKWWTELVLSDHSTSHCKCNELQMYQWLWLRTSAYYANVFSLPSLCGWPLTVALPPLCSGIAYTCIWCFTTNRTLHIIIDFLDLIHHPIFYLKEYFRDWTLSPSLGRSLLSLAQSVELVPISGQGPVSQTFLNKKTWW
jgi:hypothetical protein